MTYRTAMSTSGTTANLTPEELGSLRESLLTLRAENEADLESATAIMDGLAAEHLVTDPTVHEVAANAEYMIEDATGIIAMIDAALRRMDAGTYSICDGCGNPIPFARLELRPYVTKCVSCSS